MNVSPNGLDGSGNVADHEAWLASNPGAPRWLRETVATLCPSRVQLTCPTCGGGGFDVVCDG